MGEAALVAQRPVVQVSGFGKRYGRQPAVEGVSLAVAPGEIYGLIGPDGAGKSSLMKAVAGVLAYDAGEVRVFGEAIDSERAAERVKPRLGFMPQGLGLNLYPELSVEENVDFFAHLRLVPETELAARKAQLLAATRLARFRDRPMKHLSGGMKQKLGLACTLIHAPELIILDEPTTGVDPVSRRDFWVILSELMQVRGVTALVSTAYLDEASRFHRLALMYGGRILAEGTPESLRAQVAGTLVVARAAPQAQALNALRGVFPQVDPYGATLRAFTDGEGAEAAMARARAALAEVEVQQLTTQAPNLDDVFIALLRRQGLAQRASGADLAPAARSEAASDESAIEASGLTRDFDSFRAVDGVSFRVRPGEVFGLLGANGAGKTTVIKMLTGILPPSAGTGRVGGADMRRAARAIKARVGYVSQSFSLYADLSARENILLYAGIYGLDRAETARRAAWVVDMGGLERHLDLPAGRLPVGLRQRLALGCALLHRPRVLFLDEPTSGVDPAGRRQFWDILFGLSRHEGVAILVTTHYMSEAEHCDRLALMFDGRIVADASPAELKRQVGEQAGLPLAVLADPPAVALRLLREGGFAGAALFGRHIHVLSRDHERDRLRIAAALGGDQVKLLSVAPEDLSMEDVFVHRVTALEASRPTAGTP